MNCTRNSDHTSYAQKLRREMTAEERHLWYDFLKQLPVTVNRQKVLGPYIVDFYCADAKLVIELDGSQHFEPEMFAQGRERGAFLKGLCLCVLRYSNREIHQQFRNVCEDILAHL